MLELYCGTVRVEVRSEEIAQPAKSRPVDAVAARKQIEKTGNTMCIFEQLTVSVEDFGKGIADIEKAKEPFFTTKPELERSGMGFAFMEAFMDSVLVESVPGTGTKVTMKKYIRSGEA